MDVILRRLPAGGLVKPVKREKRSCTVEAVRVWLLLDAEPLAAVT